MVSLLGRLKSLSWKWTKLKSSCKTIHISSFPIFLCKDKRKGSPLYTSIPQCPERGRTPKGSDVDRSNPSMADSTTRARGDNLNFWKNQKIKSKKYIKLAEAVQDHYLCFIIPKRINGAGHELLHVWELVIFRIRKDSFSHITWW